MLDFFKNLLLNENPFKSTTLGARPFVLNTNDSIEKEGLSNRGIWIAFFVTVFIIAFLGMLIRDISLDFLDLPFLVPGEVIAAIHLSYLLKNNSQKNPMPVVLTGILWGILGAVYAYVLVYVIMSSGEGMNLPGLG